MHLVADLERGLHRLLLAHPPPLRADHQEVHRQRDQQQDPELDEAGGAAAAVVFGGEDGEDVHRVPFPISPGGRPGRRRILPTRVTGHCTTSRPRRPARRRRSAASVPAAIAARMRSISCSVQATLCRLTQPRRRRLADGEEVAQVAAAVPGAHRAGARRRRAARPRRAWRAALTCSLAGRSSAPCRGGRGGSASRSRTGRRRAATASTSDAGSPTPIR